jgi:signal transduction histidine kinase
MILNRIIFFIGLVLLLASFYLAVFVPASEFEKKFFDKVTKNKVEEIRTDLKEKAIQSEIVNFKMLPCYENCEAYSNVITKLRANIRYEGLLSYQLLNDKKQDVIYAGNSLNRIYNKQFDEALEKDFSSVLEKGVNEDNTASRQLVYFSRLNVSGTYYVLLLRFNYIDSSFNPNFYSYALVAVYAIGLALIIVYSSRTKQLEGNIEQITQLEEEIKTVKLESATKNQFLANFTHELRTPLNSIIGFSGMLKDETLGSLGNPEYVKFSNEINNSGIHLLSIINDILDYSKAESGKLKVNMVETDISKIIRQCVGIIAPRAAESRVELLESLFENHYVLMVDAKRFKQVILNLLSNAVKFTPEGGSVKVTIFPDLKGERLSIEVKDTGVGIAEKDIPTVLSLFGQVENQLSRRYEGTGIGLPFSKKLTNLMGGSFEIASQVGVGTIITLTFPFDKSLNSVYGKNF